MEQIKYKHVSYEHKKEDNIKEFIDSIPKNSIFYDLGANLGWFSLYAANLGLTVYAFEVDDFNYLGLIENINLNPKLSNKIFPFNKGVADTFRTLKLRCNNQEIGGHHKTLDLENFSGPKSIISTKFTKEIEVDSLDNYIEKNNLPFPEYLKVDIDGSEYAFLQGATKVLANAKAMVIELCLTSDFYIECLQILNSNNFKITKVYPIPGWADGFNFVFEKIK